MRKIILLGALIVSIAVIGGCGDGSSGAGDAGMTPEVAQFMNDYEKFVDSYCELASQMKEAKMGERPALLMKYTKQAQKLASYSQRNVAIQASLSDAAQKRIDALQVKVNKCGEEMQQGMMQ